ncbi:hypothetical protein L210DRAFT_3759168 [Boletus edulis BED1]|uniref:Fungal-type protein kinase domain-containing protein n=1 Tax=Boletus edulis BED1 TaxID=1328754 RepID=A0AAD4C052_BOLED|nr:hypothetical protein L210DRAFT_3759168 [Boletus edulis BED1]
MDGRWLGAMPVDTFLNKYFPATEEPLPDLPDNPFENVPSKGSESGRYDPFITAIQEWMPHLQAVNTSTKGDKVNKVNLKTDISIYNRVGGVPPPDRTDFSRMELWMEFKATKDGAAFRDPRIDTEEERLLAIETGSFTPDTDEGKKARGQLAHYAGAQHSQQFRHFSFSVVIQEDHARFLRWDPSATVVTAEFNYRTNPRLMVEFLWRFDHLSPKQRGHDVSIQLANLAPEVDARVREKLGIKNSDIALYQYEVPGMIGMGYAYGPRFPTENRSLVSRCTRSSPVVWIPNEDVLGGTKSCGEPGSHSERNVDEHVGEDEVKKGPWSKERVIYMKDTWRFLSDLADVEVMPEHEIYEILHQHRTPHIPELVIGGDVDGGRTQTQELVDAPWLCVQPRISPYQHYRLVHGIVGRPLFQFDSTKQLVTAVFDALQAHSHAVNYAKLLHRDISVGNIILTDEGKGLLIDWEMAKKMDEHGSRRPDRTGTWQFMSANLLQQPGKFHTVTDDLESFLHVLAWTTIRYVPAIDSYSAGRRGKDLASFDEHDEMEGHCHEGGHLKGLLLAAGKYPSSSFQPRCKTPLFELLQELRKPFKSLYGDPPTDTDRKKVEFPFDQSDWELVVMRAAIDRYEKDMACLQSSTWFVDTIKMALDKQEWPTDDKADRNIRITFPRETPRQEQIRTSHRQRSQAMWRSSKALPSSSKRAASPTPGPSSKRPRGTPAACGTRC